MAASHVLSIRKSKLNFVISKTSYSVQICLRKRFRKDAENIEPVESSEKVSETPNKLMKDIEVLKNSFASLEKELKKAGNIIEQSKAVTEKQKDEIKLLKAALAESKRQSDHVYSDLVETKQVVKAKDKEIYNLSKTIENKNNNISSLKQSNGDLKSVKSKLETKIRIFEKKILKL